MTRTWLIVSAPMTGLPLGITSARFSLADFTGILAVLIFSSVGLAACLLAYPIATLGGNVRLTVFARAVLPAQAVAIYVARWMVIGLSPSVLFAGAAIAAITTVGSVSLPGQVSFLTSFTHICVVMVVAIEPLALLVAVEMIPDLVRTVGNVTMDVAATSVISRLEQKP